MKKWTTKSGYVVTRVLARRCNVFLLSNGETSILVDTSRRGYRRRLFSKLDELGISRLEALILSHTHFDHAENAAAVRARYKAKVVVHESEAAFLRSGNSPLPSGTILAARMISRLPAKKVRQWFAYEPCESDILVNGNYMLSEFGFNGYLLPTPGHSRGMISVIIDDEIALVGDTLFSRLPGKVFPPFADDVAQLTRSWGMLMETGCRLFLPSHGGAVGRDLLAKSYNRRDVGNF